jgi:hypothetical protein
MVKPKSFRPWNPQQTLLRPPSPVDWLPANHLVFFLLDLATELDLEAIHAVYRQKDPRDDMAYEPRMMVVLLLYAYCVGSPSSRKIEKACWEDAAFRVLTGNQQPDHSRIDVDPGDRSRVNESPQPARLGLGLHHETDQALTGADYPQALAEGFCEAVNRRAADRLGQDRRRDLPRHRGGAADLSPLAAAVRRSTGRGSQASDSAGEEKCQVQEASGGGRAGEGHSQGPCCAVRRTLRCDGKLLSPERRRRAVKVLQDRYRASERFVCRVAGQHRSTQRHGGKIVDIEEA